VKLTPWMLTIAAFGLISLLAAGFLFKKLTAREVVAEPKVERRSLPMAITDIEPGTLVTAAHVGNGPWQNDSELSPDTFTNREGVIGRIAREKITAARPLRGSQFYAPGDLPDLKVADGMRAVTINVGDETAMVNGLIKPGQFVDVHMTIDRSSTTAAGPNRLAANDAMTLTLFDGVKVIAMNRSYNQSSVDRGHNVTLELDSEQSRIMLLAKEKGTVALSYNPSGAGNGGVSVKGGPDRVTLQQILGIEPPAEKEKPFMTEHFREGMRSTTYFQDGRRVGYTGGDFGDNDNGAVPLSSGGDGWGPSTSTGDQQKNQNLSQQKSSAAAL
jgi:pilus assembly protein CpaB